MTVKLYLNKCLKIVRFYRTPVSSRNGSDRGGLIDAATLGNRISIVDIYTLKLNSEIAVTEFLQSYSSV